MTSLRRLWPAWPGWILGALLLIIGNIHCTVAPEPPLDGSTTGNIFVQDLKMPGVKPTQHDEYVCTAKRVESREAFIVQYEAHSPNNKAHHILLFGCKDVDPKNLAKGHWGCGEGNICQNMKIMFAWAKNAPPTTLPPDVGFRIGGDSGVNYLVLEIHYAHPLNDSDSSGILLHTTYEPQTYIAGIFLLLAQDSKIPPRHPAVHTDINCLYKSRVPIHPFAYRVHAHSLGVVISGYKYNTKQSEWTQLGKGNPQWPQAFYPMEKVHKVDNTDILVARCTFNSTGRDRWTYIGSTAADEMCNFYIMYYTDSQRGSPFGECVDTEYPGIVDMMPLDSDVPLPRNPLLEEHAHGSNPMQHSKVTKRPLNIPQDSSLEAPLLGGREHEGTSGFDPIVGDSSEYNGPVPYRGKVHHGNYNQGMEDNSATTGAGVPEGKAFLGILGNTPLPNLFKDQLSWPNLQKKLGQVTAVSLDSIGNVWIFHRGNRVWDASTFDVRNRFMQMSLGPILENTIIKLDKELGTVLHEWGNNLFYMPHGLTIDKDGNIWITDVAMHQVMKFPPGGNDGKPLMTLGTPFEPGSDNSHFCKPTSVAVAENGEFFVADGYCNSRILKYSPTGTLQLQWGKSTTAILNFKIGTPPPYAFDIPHKVALAEDKGLVCVADRENGRIQCFNMNNGSFHCQMQPPEFGGRLFAVAYSPAQGGLLYAVNGPTIYGNTNNVQGFVVNLTSQQVIGSIRPGSQNLQNPHDIAVSSDGSAVYIAEIGPNKLWKFISIRLASSKQLPSMSVANKSVVEQPLVKVTPSTTVAASLPLRNTQADNKEVFMSPLSNDSSSFALSMIIIAVLSIPILLMIIITIVIRLRKQGKFHSMNLGHVKGWMTGYKQPNSDRFNLGNFLHPHKGFDRVSMEESDAELDNSDSDVEEYSASVQKA